MRTGCFIKTPAPHIVEVLSRSGLDFGVADAEHGPFDRTTLDLAVLAARAENWPLYIRVADDRPGTIGAALDLGASGVIVPHVDTAEQGRQVVRRARFGHGIRGFSNAPRYARYGTMSIPDAVAQGDRSEIFVQIESAEGVDNAAAIAALPGIAGLMVGRADLALSLGTTDMTCKQVHEMTLRVLAACRNVGKIGCIASGSADDIPSFLTEGASMFVIGSDQSFLLAQARGVAEAARRHGSFCKLSGDT